MPNLIASADLMAAVNATLLIRAGAVLAIAWLLTRALRGAAASTRHAVWSAALTSLLLLPVGAAVLPRWNLPGANGPLPVSALPPRLNRALSASMSTVSGATDPHAVHGAVLPPAVDPARGRPAPIVLALLALWAAGVCIGLARMALCLRAVWLVDRRSVRADASVLAQADAARRELGLRRAVDIRWTDALTVPVNWGVVRPVILLPGSAATWSSERLRVVLLHELAHVRRWDYLALMVTRLAQAFYWMNPLVWVAARQAEMELERATDDEVLRAGTGSVDYATHLHAIAERLAGAGETRGALAMARPSTLRERVSAILAGTIDRRPLSPRAVAGAASVMALVALPLAGVRLLGEGRVAAQERGALLSLNLNDAPWRARGAFALGTRHSRAAIAPLSIRLRDDADPSVRGMSAWALGEIGDARALPALTAALSDRDPHVREMAVLALGALGDRRAVAALAPLAADSFDGVRSVLTRALQNIGGDEAAAVLARIVLTDRDEHTRSMAVWSVRMMAGGDKLATLTALLADSSASMRRMAAHNLGELGDARAVPMLEQRIALDTAASVRAGAAWALGKLGTDRAITGLAAAIRDADWHVRVAAAEALGHTGGPRVADLLMSATRDPVHQVRLTAVEALEARAR